MRNPVTSRSQCPTGAAPSWQRDSAGVLESPGLGAGGLTRKHCENILGAVEHARRIELPLNRFVTINWEAAGVSSSAATGAFLKRASDWLRSLGYSTAFVWTQERGDKIGQHAHILMHVPPHLARRFAGRQRGWLKQGGARFHKGLIKSRPIGRSLSAAMIPGYAQGAYEQNLSVVTCYILKEADDGARGLLTHLFRQTGNGIVGKRASTSQNVGLKARSVATPSPE